jgi:hypothetical protein
MARKNDDTADRFQSLAEDEQEPKRTNVQTTPEAFKPPAKGHVRAASIGAPSLAVPEV